ncbi:MAG TPA: coproporphyrinogen III oxidase [Clostridiaceae bacterium]
MIRIKINEENHRYDAYQIFNLFYLNLDFTFVEDKEDLSLEIYEDELIIVKKKFENYIFKFDIITSKKENIKKGILIYLEAETGYKPPWGTLVGIRPTKIALSLLEKNENEEEIYSYYQKHYRTSKEKTSLCLNIAKKELKFLNSDKNTISLYIHMPFCPSRCNYCSFTSNPIKGNKMVSQYLEALVKELQAIKIFITQKNLIIENVYFGGGTPTSLDIKDFNFIMEEIYNNFIYKASIKEFNVECGRPDSIDKEKLNLMKEFGVNRISINPQTMNEKTLKSIGRNHTPEDIINKYYLARSIGFDNINMDIIIGLPGETEEEITHTCEELYKLAPDSVTVHGMSIKRASKLYEDSLYNKMDELPEATKSNMYNIAEKLADRLDMTPYYLYRQKNTFGNGENVGYSKKSKEGIYNIQMIEDRQTIIAIGADSVSKVVYFDNRLDRFSTVKDIKQYVKEIDEIIKNKIEFLSKL